MFCFQLIVADNDIMDFLNLAELDCTPRADLLPSIWMDNLEALSADQPDFASRLQELTLPDFWRPVAGLDGFPTWRIEPEGQPPSWLAGTAAPLARAEGLLRLDLLKDKNPALPTIAVGAELKLLLDRLDNRQAVYVFERAFKTLVPVLRLVDFSADIRAGRCIFVPPFNEEVILSELLSKYPGLLPPGILISLPNQPDERLTELCDLCERVSHRTSEVRHQRMKSLAICEPEPLSVNKKPNFAVLAFGADQRSYKLAANLADSASAIGWRACSRIAAGPREIHSIIHHEELSRFTPNLVIAVGHSPGSFPIGETCILCQWHVKLHEIASNCSSDNYHHLAASPDMMEELRRFGVPKSRIHKFFWALPQLPATPTSPGVNFGESGNSKCVALIGDIFDTSAAACGIEQPTHQQLWKQIDETAHERCFTSDILYPESLLRKGEIASGVKISDASLRERFLRIVKHVLIPTVVLQTISQRLTDEGYEVHAVGKGWRRCSDKQIKHLADDIGQIGSQAPARQAIAPPVRLPGIAIFANPIDALQRAMFDAIAMGSALLIFNPAPRALTEKIGGILSPRAHYQPFAQFRELKEAINRLREEPDQRRRQAERTLEHVSTHHTYGQRLENLLHELA